MATIDTAQGWSEAFRAQVDQLARDDKLKVDDRKGADLTPAETDKLVARTAPLFEQLGSLPRGARQGALMGAFRGLSQPTMNAFMARKLLTQIPEVEQSPADSIKQIAENPLTDPVQRASREAAPQAIVEARAAVKAFSALLGTYAVKLDIVEARTKAESAVTGVAVRNGEPEIAAAVDDRSRPPLSDADTAKQLAGLLDQLERIVRAREP